MRRSPDSTGGSVSAGRARICRPRDGLNVDGKAVPQRGYITDELTDYALDWLKGRGRQRPFFLYLSHKAVHSEFVPAERHKGRYAGQAVHPPATMADTARNYDGKPMWVRNQRNSWHGVDFPYHSALDIAAYYRRYAETLLAVDDSLGRIVAVAGRTQDARRHADHLHGRQRVLFRRARLDRQAHGLRDVDARAAADGRWRPARRQRRSTTSSPTSTSRRRMLEAAGVAAPPMDGRSFLPLARGERTPWRESLLYQYYWERNFPQTPTMHAVRGARYKYIRYYGLWDTDELYDLVRGPAGDPQPRAGSGPWRVVARMNRELFEGLAATDGLVYPACAGSRRRAEPPPAWRVKGGGLPARRVRPSRMYASSGRRGRLAYDMTLSDCRASTAAPMIAFRRWPRPAPARCPGAGSCSTISCR